MMSARVRPSGLAHILTFNTCQLTFATHHSTSFPSFVNCSVWDVIGQLGNGLISRKGLATEVIVFITFKQIAFKVKPKMGFAIHIFLGFSCAKG